MPSPRLARVLRAAAYFFLSFIVLSYLGLIVLGRWQLDEYAEFYHMRTRDAQHYLLERLSWSPRPISETLYCLYGWAVNHFHHQFIVPLLGGLWVLFLVAGFLTSWLRSRHSSEEVLWPSSLVALTLMALFLAGGHLTEVFYWPAGAVAYLPTLAATLLLFLQVIESQLDSRRGRFIAAICLTVAAGSSEAGAAFVLCYAIIQLFQWARKAAQNRGWSGGPSLWYTVPLLAASVVLLTVRLNRFRVPEAEKTGAAAGHPVVSLLIGFKEMAIEIIGRSMLVQTSQARQHSGQWMHLGLRLSLEMLAGSRLWMEILLLVGVALCWSLRRPTQRLVRQILELITAFLVASLFTITAANMHFGSTCCERHELLRESWTTMVLTGVAIIILSRINEPRRQWLARRCSFAPLLLMLAVVSLGCVGPLLRTYKNYSWLRRVNEQNFDSGFQQDKEQMNFSVLPYEGIIGEEPIPSGAYTRPPAITGFSYGVYPYYLLGFFDKQRVVIHSIDTP